MQNDPEGMSPDRPGMSPSFRLDCGPMLRIETATATPARKDTGPPGKRHNDGLDGKPSLTVTTRRSGMTALPIPVPVNGISLSYSPCFAHRYQGYSHPTG